MDAPLGEQTLDLAGIAPRHGEGNAAAAFDPFISDGYARNRAQSLAKIVSQVFDPSPDGLGPPPQGIIDGDPEPDFTGVISLLILKTLPRVPPVPPPRRD